MSGCFGGHPIDRWLEAQVDRYTDPPGAVDPDELAEWVAEKRAALVAEMDPPDTLHGPERVSAKLALLDELRCFDRCDHAEEYLRERRR